MQHRDVLPDVLSALTSLGAKPSSRPNAQGTYSFRCIRHNDATASAWVGNGAWGCSACGFEEPIRSLCDTLGVNPPKFGFTLEDYADLKLLPVDKLMQWGLSTAESDRGAQVVRIPYRDTEGKELRARYRGANGVWWDKGVGIHLYGLWRLDKNPSHPVVLVEGESDCHAAWLHGILAIGCPGASSWRREWANFLRNRNVYVWQEPDKGGLTFVQAVAASFPNARVLRHPKLKDIAELHKAFPEPEAFKAEFGKIVAEAHPVGLEPPSVQFDGLFGGTLDRLLEQKLKPVDAVPTPLVAWNKSCRDEGGGKGLARGWHVILAGRPGFGKSIMALNCAESALQAGESVAFCSLEMSQMQLATRLMAMASGVPISELEKGSFFKQESYAQARYAMDAIRERTGGGIYVNRGKLSTLKDIDAAIRYHHAVNGCRMFIVDYLQLAWTGSASGILDRIMEVSKTLRDLAVELDVVSIGLSQFNRETTSNRTNPPTSQGLMGGSVLENDADQIVLLDHSTYEEVGDDSWRTNLILDKNRHGRILAMPVIFNRRTLKVSDDNPAPGALEGK